MTGLKRKDIQKCCACGRGVMHDGLLTFYRVTLEQHAVDLGAVQRLNGLEQMVSPVLAAVMGPDEDLTAVISAPTTKLVCEECALTQPIADLMGD